MFKNVIELIELATVKKCAISQIMIEQEMKATRKTRSEIIAIMGKNLEIMEQAIKKGLTGVKSHSGLTGGDAKLLDAYFAKNKAISGNTTLKATRNAIATNEVNAAMGVICATPTAGSAGVVPGVLFAIKDQLNATKEEMINFLFNAGAFGLIVANNACISGAAGGCQAEIGSASAMAASATVELAGGSPKQCAEAFAIALKNLLGLVCDPVAGLVEVPCIKRNAIGATNALTSADMALAGIVSKIPCDEVIGAMFAIGKQIPTTLRETALGGLAQTKSGLAAKEKIFGNEHE